MKTNDDGQDSARRPGMLRRVSLTRRVVMLYCALILFVCFFFSTLLLLEDRRKQDEMIETSHTALLELLITWVGSALSDRVESIVSEQLLGLQQGTALYGFLHDGEGAQSMAALRLHQQLQTLVLTHPYLEAVWVRAGQGGELLSTEQGAFLSFEGDTAYDRYINRDLFTTLSQTTRTAHFLPINPSRINGSQTMPVSYIRTLSLGNARGLLVMRVDLKGCVADLLSASSSGATCLVYNQGGDLLTRYGEDAGPEQQPAQWLESAQGFLREGRQVISWRAVEKHGLRYVLAIPYDFYTGAVLSPVLPLFIALGALVFMLLAWLGGTRMFRALNQALQGARSGVALPAGHSEAEIVKALTENLAQRNINMSEMQERYSRAKAQTLLGDLISGRVSTAEDLRRILRQDHGIPWEGAMTLVGLRFEQEPFGKLDLAYRHALLMSTEEDIMRFFALESDSFSLVGSAPEADLLILLFPREAGALPGLLARLSQALLTRRRLRVTLALSEAVSSPADLPAQYAFCRRALMYRFLEGEGHVFTPENITTRVAGRPVDWTGGDVAGMLLKNDTASLRTALNDLPRTVSRERWSLEAALGLLVEICVGIDAACQTLSLPQHFPATEQTLQGALLSLETLEAATAWLLEALDAFEAAHKKGLSDLRQGFTLQIRDWIDAHIDRQITLQMTADAFGISTGHLSRLFKAAFNQSFLEYVTEQKFAHACRQLTDTNTPIAEITGALGYANTSYFSRLFKERYGLTPSQYRKRHRTPGQGNK